MKINELAFVIGEEDELLLDFIKFVMKYNHEAKEEEYIELKLSTDGYCHIVDFFQDSFDMREGKFEYVDSDHYIAEYGRDEDEEENSFPEVKYSKGDLVKFKSGGDIIEGTVEIVDKFGTFDQNEEPSYDISAGGCLYKHVRQSSIL